MELRTLFQCRHVCLSIFLALLLPSISFQNATLDRRELPPLSSDNISKLLAVSDPLKNLDPSNPASHLAKILIPRPPDTDNNTLVRNYIVSTLKSLKWHVELDEFTDKTPVGTKRFANIIATKDPTASRRVVLSAHFDSKYFPHFPANQFLGATDSAAPCAMMLDLAETLNPLLDKRKERLEDGLDEEDDDTADTTLQLVFFDGEEAFIDWTSTDSIYGARHLAQKWDTTYVLPNQKRRLLNMQTTELDGIEHLILLDLLGAADPSIRSYFLDTAWLFDSLVSVERRLGDAGAFSYGNEKGMAPGKWKSWFLPRATSQYNGHVGDDHVPFLERGVSVLHLIAEPFPHVWHTIKDDASALDAPTLRRWNLMLRVFMSEYLNLQTDDFISRSESSNSVRRSDSELVSISLS